MIELRWIEREVGGEPTGYYFEGRPVHTFRTTERVLQYREGQYFKGDYKASWVGSDWQDVPVVKEG